MNRSSRQLRVWTLVLVVFSSFFFSSKSSAQIRCVEGPQKIIVDLPGKLVKVVKGSKINRLAVLNTTSNSMQQYGAGASAYLVEGGLVLSIRPDSKKGFYQVAVFQKNNLVSQFTRCFKK